MGLLMIPALGLAVGCQLLLPSEDDGDTTSGRGGAQSSQSSTSTDKASSAKASTADASASVTATASSTTDAASSSSGGTCEQGEGCAADPPTFDVCETSAVCASTGGDDWCNDYCTSITQKCGNNSQYASASQCCAACQYLRAKGAGIAPTNNVCCRADALNIDAPLGAVGCTKAGPMGVAKNDNTMVGECGSQAIHVCKLFDKVCSGKVDPTCITTGQCMLNFGNVQAETYGPNATGPMSTVLNHMLAAALGGDVVAECEAAAALACDTIATPVGSSGTGP